MRVGTPRTSPSGRRRIAPLDQTEALELAGETSSLVISSSLQSSIASGLRARNASAPTSTCLPPIDSDWSSPPTRSDASRTTIRVPGAEHDASSQAADSPEIPPPTTTTVGMDPGSLTATFQLLRRLLLRRVRQGCPPSARLRRAKGCARTGARRALLPLEPRHRGRRAPRGAPRRNPPGRR